MSAKNWHDVRRKHVARVPNGSPFSAFTNAMRSASREYRGVEKAITRSRPRASNPRGIPPILLYGGLAVGGYFLYQRMQKKNGS